MTDLNQSKNETMYKEQTKELKTESEGDQNDKYLNIGNLPEEVTHYAEKSPLVEAAYDIGEEHIILLNTSDGMEIRHEPAKREALHQDELLWTIPTNWNVGASFKIDGEKYLICYIFAADIRVLVKAPGENSEPPAYQVEQFGCRIAHVYDKPDFDNLVDLIDHLKDNNGDPALIDGLDNLARIFEYILIQYTRQVREWAAEKLTDLLYGEDVPAFDSWVMDIFDDPIDMKHIIPNNIDADEETVERMIDLLDAWDAMCQQPRIKIGFLNPGMLPVGYSMRGMIEAGATLPEAIDYIMIEQHNESVESWAQTRGVTQSIVSKNVRHARQVLGTEANDTINDRSKSTETEEKEIGDSPWSIKSGPGTRQWILNSRYPPVDYRLEGLHDWSSDKD